MLTSLAISLCLFCVMGSIDFPINISLITNNIYKLTSHVIFILLSIDKLLYKASSSFSLDFEFAVSRMSLIKVAKANLRKEIEGKLALLTKEERQRQSEAVRTKVCF